jgi:hypothetical protein
VGAKHNLHDHGAVDFVRNPVHRRTRATGLCWLGGCETAWADFSIADIKRSAPQIVINFLFSGDNPERFSVLQPEAADRVCIVDFSGVRLGIRRE